MLVQSSLTTFALCEVCVCVTSERYHQYQAPVQDHGNKTADTQINIPDKADLFKGKIKKSWRTWKNHSHPADFNPGPSFCEVAALTAAPQCRHKV